MNLLAKSHGITLSDEELKLVDTAAAEYYTSLNETEIKDMNITQDVIVNLYSEYALADKVYNDIIKDINPEISDDEARTITVEQILFKTYSMDSDGNKVACTDAYKAQQYQKAQEVLTQLSAGINFEDLMTTYSEDNTGTYSFGKGEMEDTFEAAAFQLGNDEVSGIIENDEGYHIIKCISTFNREETDANKIKIVEQRKNEVFGEEYDTFVSTLKKNINQKLWDSVTFIHDEEVTTKTFFDVYDRYFQVS
jgi:foldase protein PrsA